MYKDIRDSQHPLFNQNRHWKATLRYRYLRLQGLSSSALARELKGRDIAVVGNAQSLFDRKLGSAIDAHQIVIRINHGWVRDSVSQGTRTDVLALTAKVPEEVVDVKFCPNALLWLSPHAKVPGYSRTLVRRTCFLGARKWLPAYRALQCRVRPSSGFLLLWWLRHEVRFQKLSIFGFDFNQSKTFYTGKHASPAHDFELERQVIEKWDSSNLKIY